MTLDDPLHVTGQLVVSRTSGQTTLTFGWFNSETTRGSYPRNALRMLFNGESNGCEIYVGYTTGENRSEGIRALGVGPRARRSATSTAFRSTPSTRSTCATTPTPTTATARSSFRWGETGRIRSRTPW